MMKVACFTGHRPSKFPFRYDETDPRAKKIKSLLKGEIRRAIRMGYDTFVSGWALGVDTWAAEAVLELKADYSHIRLWAAIPCIGQDSQWPKPSRERYQHLLSQADEVHYVSRLKYEPYLMQVRNRWMVDRSALLIAVFDGTAGGTKNAFDYAKSLRRRIVQINPTDMTMTDSARILECSSKGDKRFSSFAARVTVFGQEDTIENLYQTAKRFGGQAPASWRDAKGKAPTHLEIQGKTLPVEYLTPWFHYLWWAYLESRPDLVVYARGFDDFDDLFKGKNTLNCQADAIRTYIQEGPDALLAGTEPLIQALGLPTRREAAEEEDRAVC